MDRARRVPAAILAERVGAQSRLAKHRWDPRSRMETPTPKACGAPSGGLLRTCLTAREDDM
eukprot:9791757-Alexandrium_andersonii.AAC.1